MARKHANNSGSLPVDYMTGLVMKRDREGMKQYNKWLRQHQAELRRLEREARGELVPGDYDSGEAYS